MSGKRVALEDLLSFDISARWEAVFADTTCGLRKYGPRSLVGSPWEPTKTKSWSMKQPRTSPSCFKESTGTEQIAGTGWSTPVFVLTCVQPFSVKASLLKDLPRTSFCEELWRQVLGQILKSYENSTQAMLSSLASTRSASETSQAGTR